MAPQHAGVLSYTLSAGVQGAAAAAPSWSPVLQVANGNCYIH
jgi:hypothetical protein